MAKPPAVKSSKPGTAVVSWAEKLANKAQEAASEERMSSASALSFRSGQLNISGQPVAGNALSVIVVGSVFENQYYDPAYDYEPDSPRSPICFAFSKKEGDLAPHEDSAIPQHEQCGMSGKPGCCEWNEFGSAEKGRGKACKNIRRLALISAAPLTPEAVRDGEILQAKLPVTSGPGWAQYVNMLAATYQRPPWAVITEIGAVPDPKTQFKVTFTFKGLISEDLLDVLEARHETTYDLLAIPYQANSEEEKPVKKKPVAKARKF